ncbi:MAG TPA: enoyl-CoA hydratase-related protein [Nitrospiraceae bacterium]|jgi:methylglutaconyl-CoA hydratase|nr:enoyl-CoA hydratase-related protein [Nitrospiraceae bacterium]
MTECSSVLVESHKGVARVTLNRAHRRNAFDAGMIDELYDAFRTIVQDASLRVVLLRGNGSVFCAGADLRWMGADRAVSETEARQDAERLFTMFRAIDECPCPVIARVQGAAYGGALGLIGVCDVAVATDDTVFGLSEVRLGLVPAVIAPFVVRKMGDSFLRRYGLTGQAFSASAAKEAGLVHEVVPRDALDARVDELVQNVSRLAPHAVRTAKSLFRRLPSLSDPEQRTLCIDINVQARLSAEAREGLRAFHERRPPGWAPKADGPADTETVREGNSRDAAPQRI